MTNEKINESIAMSIGYERLVIDYESLTDEPGLVQGEDCVWRTQSHNKWLKQVQEQEVQCVGEYFVRLSDGAIFADFDGPDNGINGRGNFQFTEDLNAIHSAVVTLSSQQYWTFVRKLHGITNGKGEIAEAMQACQAYLFAI